MVTLEPPPTHAVLSVGTVAIWELSLPQVIIEYKKDEEELLYLTLDQNGEVRAESKQHLQPDMK